MGWMRYSLRPVRPRTVTFTFCKRNGIIEAENCKGAAMRKKKKKRIFPLVFMLLVCIGFLIWGAKEAATIYFQKLPESVNVIKNAVSHTIEESIPFSEIVIEEAEVSSGFYYQLLSDGQQLIYKEILQAVRGQAESFYIHTGDTKEFSMIYEYLLYDRPEIFWCTGGTQITSYTDYSEVHPVYTCQSEELQQRQTQIDAAAAACLAGISMDAPEYDRIRYVFEYLVNTVDYNLDSPDNQNIYSSLVNRVSVCAGYSRAAQYLLQKLGIECIYAIGTIPQQGPHAWNIVRCNGQYYHMDVTFGDPVFLQEENGANIPLDSINYGYLCCADSELYRSHTPEAGIPYPECLSMDLDYYVLNGMYYEGYDSYVMLLNMNQSIYEMRPSFSCKFSYNDLYLQAHDDIINNVIPQAAQTLAVHYGLDTVWYTYVEDPMMSVITVYWRYQ